MTPVEVQTAVTIEKLVYGGDGLARLASGEVIFVPWSAPGDVATVAPQPGSRPLRGRIETLVEPSPVRAEPPCSVFGRCGGCQWQHLQAEAQHDWKRRMVEESFRRIAKLEISPEPTLHGAPWHTRNRVQWSVSVDADHGVVLGYQAAQSHDVIAFDHCWIAAEPLNTLADWLKTNLDAESAGAIRRIEAFCAGPEADAPILLTVSTDKTGLPAAAASWMAKLPAAFPALAGLVMWPHQGQPKPCFGKSHLHVDLDGLRYRVSAGSFFQTSFEGASLLLNCLKTWLLPDATTLADLYAGVGTFALALAPGFSRVLAVESSRSAVSDLKANCVLRGATHVQALCADVGRELNALDEQFDVAVLDPPRAGCPKSLLDWIDAHVTRQVLYVSCDPTTLARDVRILSDRGWRVERVQPIDLFPQTYHVETVVDLRRGSS